MDNNVKVVSEAIKEEFLDEFLVKPLDPVKVKKEFSEPVVKNTTEDEGIEVADYEEVKTEVKEVDSDFRKGIVLKVPKRTYGFEDATLGIEIGDTVIFRSRDMRYYDLINDSVLLKLFHIVAVEKC